MTVFLADRMRLAHSTNEGKIILNKAKFSRSRERINPLESANAFYSIGKNDTDVDMRTDISAEVLFADYRTVNGLQIPFRIQRHIGGGVLDVTLTDATLNSAVSASTFSIR